MDERKSIVGSDDREKDIVRAGSLEKVDASSAHAQARCQPRAQQNLQMVPNIVTFTCQSLDQADLAKGLSFEHSENGAAEAMLRHYLSRGSTDQGRERNTRFFHSTDGHAHVDHMRVRKSRRDIDIPRHHDLSKRTKIP